MKSFKFLLIITYILCLKSSLNAEIPHYLDFKFILNSSTAGKKAQDYLKNSLEKGLKNITEKEKKILNEEKEIINHQINQTLEQMAQAIFKSWFVDFEPVRAKMEAKKRWHALQPGNEPASPVCYAGEPQPLPDLETYMNLAAMQAISGKDADQLTRMQAEQPEQYAELQTTAALFPAAMQASELGEIPEGWEVGSFQDLCIKVESGGTPKRKSPEYWGGNIKWLSSGEVRDVIAFDTREKITDIGLKNSAAKLWPKYTTVVAMYGATAGQVCFLAEEMTSNQACCGLIPKKNHSIFTFVAAKRSVQSLADKASGSAQQNLNKGLVAGHSTLLPPEEVLAAYEAVAFPFMLKWIENYREASLLGALRDTLLPKLLSGELSLPDAETELQEAAHA